MLLSEYWEKQLVQSIKFGFLLDFNRYLPLCHENVNHKTATNFPSDIEAYIQELKYGALLGRFKEMPLEGGHISPFMTHPKPDSDRHRVIIDLSWPPRGVSQCRN